MKTRTFLATAATLALATFSSTNSSAQTLKVWKDGEVLFSAETSAVDSISFHDYGALTDLGKTFEAVDLGLPSGTKWATFNLGATAPEEYGNYYAWGETAPKEVYNWSTYFDTEDDGDTFLKYNLDEGGKTELDAEDDAASVALGGDWRMPSHEEFTELRDNCYWVWTSTYGGKSVNGYIVYKAKAEADKGAVVTSDGTPSSGYSVETDVHVFLPAAGYRYGSDLDYAGYYGLYWSRSLSEGYADYAYVLDFRSDYVDWNYYARLSGQSVRPVLPATE